MKCVRCGYCCIDYDVIIIRPEYINEDINDILSKDFNAADKIAIHKPCGIKCPHLDYDEDGIATCKVHDKPWYKGTPCDSHTQIGKEDAVCRIGNMTIKTKGRNWHINFPKWRDE